MNPTPDLCNNSELTNRIRSEFKNDFEYADKMMMILVLMHWIAVSTLTAYTYNTYWFGLLNGGVLTVVAAMGYYFLRGTVYSRIIFGAVLMGFSAIVIQQHLGRIEMHFHIFVAIAFLTIYKDYKPAIAAALITALHHVIGNYLQLNDSVMFNMPVYIFNYGCGIDIVLLHAFFVVLEVVAISLFISVDKKRFISVITSQFRIEKFNETLEEQIQERTREYMSAKQDAEAANHAKSSFLANMSHEIRTPLNAILGFIGILQEQEQDKEKLKYISTIKKSGESLIEIINDILDFAKIESGKLSVDKIVINPHEEFDNIGSLFFAKAEDMKLHFHLYIDPHLPKAILIDGLRVRQVLTNLLSNAMKFTKSDGVVSLEIRFNHIDSTLFFSVKDSGIGIAEENQAKVFEAFTQEEDSTSRKYGGTGLGLSISVKLVELMGGKIELKSQLGIGSEFYFTLPIEVSAMESFSVIPDIANINVALFCPKEHIEYSSVLEEYLNSFGMNKRFHPEDINSLTSAQYPLVIINSNMYTANNIQALLHKGLSIIMIKSSLSENYSNTFNGKIVIIDPPFTPSSVYDALMHLFSKKINQETVSYENIDRNISGKILVAEDNDANQYLMSVILKSLKLDHEFANDGVEAIEMFKNGQYDLILMDENMPNMNGTEATRLIIELEHKKALPHTPIVALTANAIKGDRERFLSAGMDDYLTKPIDKKNLLAVLNHYLAVNPKNNDTIQSSNITHSPLIEEKQEKETVFGEYRDINELAIAMDYDVEDVQTMVNMFLNRIDEQLQVLKDASDTLDYETLFKTAHGIKGSSGNLKLTAVYNLSGEIESAARDKLAINYHDMTQKLANEVDKIRKLGDAS